MRGTRRSQTRVRSTRLKTGKRFEVSLALFCALVGAGLLFAPLRGGVPKSYDLPDHLGVTSQFLAQLERGDPYPRWMPDFNREWGEPTLIFYPPAFYYMSAAIASLCGGDALAGLFVAAGLLSVVGGLGMWQLLRRDFGRAAAVLGPLAFAAVPYRFFEIYCGGLYPAFGAMCLLPWVLVSLRGVAGALTPLQRQRAVHGWALCLALFILFNLPAAVLLAYLFAGWLVVEVFSTRKFCLIWDAGIGSVWGGLLAAIYLLPATLELPAIVVPHSLRTPLFQSNFVFQSHGFSMSAGLKSLFDRMALFPTVGFLLAIAVLWAEAKTGRPPAEPGKAICRRLIASIGLAALFFVTPLSEPLWRVAPFLKNVNLPWRLLAPLGIAAAAAFSAAIARLALGRVFSLPVTGLVLAFFLALCVLLAFFDRSISVVNGRLPAAMVRAGVPAFAHKIAYFLPTGARPPEELAGRPLAACAAPCQVNVREWGPTQRVLEVRSPRPTSLSLHTYYFPGWTAQSEGAEARTLSVSRDVSTGGIVVGIPAGQTVVRVRFENTPACRVGSLVSLAALLGWLVFALRLFPRARESEARAELI